MFNFLTERIPKSFWFALIAHLLLFMSFALPLIFFEPVQLFEKKSDRYLPAYLYEKEGSYQEAQRSMSNKIAKAEPKLKSENSYQKGIPIKEQEVQRNILEQPQVQTTNSQSSSAFIEPESIKTGKPHNEPLLKELSRATAAKLYYPPEAAAFKLKGTVTVSFLLYPDGRVEEVSVYESSGFAVLDNAALKTIRSISPVRDANLYISKPQILLAGIIFG